MYKKANEQLEKDMKAAIEESKKRRLKENQQHIKARTALYKQILADKDSPLHPSHSNKSGKHPNLLNYSPSPSVPHRHSDSPPNHHHSSATAGHQRDSSHSSNHDRDAAQQAYYEERLAAAKAAALSQTSCDANDDGYDDNQYHHHPRISSSYLAPIADSPSDPMNLSHGSADDDDRGDHLSPSRHPIGTRYESKEQSSPSNSPPLSPLNLPRISKNTSSATSSQQANEKSRLFHSSSAPHLLKAAYANPFFNPLRPKPTSSYQINARAIEAAQRHYSTEWRRSSNIATVTQLHQHGSVLHPPPSASFGAAQRAAAASQQQQQNGVAQEDSQWIGNFNPAQMTNDSDHFASPSLTSQIGASPADYKSSPISTKVRIALDEKRSSAKYESVAAQVQDSLLPMRSTSNESPSNTTNTTTAVRRREKSSGSMRTNSTSPTRPYKSAHATTGSVTSPTAMSTSEWLDSILTETSGEATTTAGASNGPRSTSSTTSTGSLSSISTFSHPPTHFSHHAPGVYSTKSKTRKLARESSKKAEPIDSTVHQRTMPISPRLEDGLF